MPATPYVVACVMTYNEAPSIGRLVESVAPHVDTILLQDHHSTDDTINAAFDASDIGVTVVTEDWTDFGHNRNLLLKNAATLWAQYDNVWFLLIDADHTVDFTRGWRAWLHDGQSSVLAVKHAGSLSYQVPRLIRPHSGHYVGVTHEYFLNTTDTPTRLFTGITIVDYADGSSHAVKFQRDIALLSEQTAKHPRDARAWFYLGQSYRDMENWLPAIGAYTRCVTESTWDEERFYAQYQIGCCYLRSGDCSSASTALLIAYSMRPTRIEPLVTLAEWSTNRGNRAYAELLLRAHAVDPIPDDVLFVERGKWTTRDLILKG